MTMIGDRKELPEEYHFGTTKEISGRDKQTSQPRPTTFTQIGPSDNSDLTLAHPRAKNLSQLFKGSKGAL